MKNRRHGVVRIAALMCAVCALLAHSPVGFISLLPLRYRFDALEPVMDRETVSVHHDKHHATYVANINKVLDDDHPSLLELQAGAIEAGPVVRNNAGGVYNHNLFWLEMSPQGSGGTPSPALVAAIDASFGSFDEFKQKFAAAAAGRFGSGWVWLIVKDGSLHLTSTANQDNPLMHGVDAVEGIPILTIDVWEHAYYLKYQNRRPEYVAAWWDLVNWNQVNSWYDAALKGTAPSGE